MITIYDIARECKCSTATVSKVFNNTGNISKEKRKEIMAAADRLGYIPNVTARNLVNCKSNMIGILLFVDKSLGLRHELFAEILNAFRMEMETKQYEILLISEESEAWNGSLSSHCQALRLDGVFCLTCDYNAEAVKELAAGSIPMVGFEIPYENSFCIESENYEASKKLTQYFLSMGHKKIAFIAGTDTMITRERIRGYRDALKDAGVSDEEFVIRSGFFSADEGKHATELLFQCGREVTAVMYPDDFTAIAGLRELKRYGKSIPDDISIAGFDGISIGRLISPQLTTIVQNANALGRACAQVLLDRIEGKAKNPAVLRLETEIFEGESVKRL